MGQGERFFERDGAKRLGVFLGKAHGKRMEEPMNFLFTQLG
jgi:hypothetical protein